MDKKSICPQLHVWRQLQVTLEEACREAGAGLPPPAYNMQAWELASPDHKRQRWAETQDWARRHGLYHFIDALGPEDFYDGD